MRLLSGALFLLLALTTLANAADSPYGVDATVRASYDLTFDEGSPVIKRLMVDGVPVRAGIDTGSPGMLNVKPAVFSKLHVRANQSMQYPAEPGYHAAGDSTVGLLQMPLLGSGRRKWFTVGTFDMADEQGVEDTDVDCLLPLDVFDSDFCIFLLSRKLLLLADMAASADSSGDEDSDYPKVMTIPYFDTEAGLFAVVSCGGEDNLAYLDTGAYITRVSQGFVERHAAVFTPSNHPPLNDENGRPFPESSYDSPAVSVGPGFVLKGSTEEENVPLGGIFEEYKPTAADGTATAPATAPLGLPDFLPFEHDVPSLAPVLSIGIDVLGRYDFMFDKTDKLLYLWDPRDTPKLFPEVAPQRRGKSHGRSKGKGRRGRK